MAVECSQIFAGCDAVFRLTLVDLDGNPVSLTGHRVQFAMRRSFQPCNPTIFVKDSAVGSAEVEILAAPDDNQALAKVLPADTEDLEEGTYWYTFKVTFSSTSLSYVVAQGTVDLMSNAFVNNA